MKDKQLLKLIIDIGKLKKLKRRGWVIRKVKSPESVADHSFRVMMIAFLIANRKLNLEKILKLALTHDLLEMETGDISPYDHVLKKSNDSKVLEKWVGNDYQKDKGDKEKVTLKNINKKIPREISIELNNLYQEYEANKTKEAQLVRQIDKLEMLIQALEYRQEGNPFPIGPFWEDVGGVIKIPSLKRLFNELNELFRE